MGRLKDFSEVDFDQLNQLCISGEYTVPKGKELGLTDIIASEYELKFWTASTVEWCIKSHLYFVQLGLKINKKVNIVNPKSWGQFTGWGILPRGM